MRVEHKTRTTGARLRYGWLGGSVHMVALVAESMVGATGIRLTHNDSPAAIASRFRKQSA